MFNLVRFLISISMVFSFFTLYATQVSANDLADPDPFDKFGIFTEESDWEINHDAWNTMLRSSVMVIPPSTRRISSDTYNTSTGTKINRGSRSPARFESNRIYYHLYGPEHITWITKYRKDLERLPDIYPLGNFNKDEQLAYWLNLYNAIVVEELAKRYPFSKLKKLREGEENSPGLWDQKLVTIEGLPLSLNDIQNNILIRHWQTPLVLYGLYQGAIGGPNMPEQAFTAKNVYGILNKNATEFINSNRGFRGEKVSLIYAWGSAAFPDWENNLLSHLVEFANPEKQHILRNTHNLKASLYDWNIADITGGTLSAGPKMDNTALNVGAAATGPQSQRILNNLLKSGLIARGTYSQNTLDLMREVARKYEELPDREGIVYSEECGTETCPESDAEPTAESDEQESEGNIIE